MDWDLIREYSYNSVALFTLESTAFIIIFPNHPHPQTLYFIVIDILKIIMVLVTKPRSPSRINGVVLRESQ